MQKTITFMTKAWRSMGLTDISRCFNYVDVNLIKKLLRRERLSFLQVRFWSFHVSTTQKSDWPCHCAVSETFRFLHISIETPARPLKVKRLMILLVLYRNLLAAVRLDSHSSLTTKISAGVITLDIDDPGVLKNHCCEQSLLVLTNDHTECVKRSHGVETPISSQYSQLK